MRFFNVDPRDGAHGGSCDTCCCQKFSIRPGESDAITINYAAWAIPFGNGIQLVAPLEVTIETDASACSTAPIDGFSPPVNTMTEILTPTGVTTAIDVAATAAPATNSFSFRVHPLSGPQHGVIEPAGAEWTNGSFNYTPAAGFDGVDVVWIDQKDAQGRIITFPVNLRVNPSAAVPVRNRGLSADTVKASFNPHYFTVTLPVTMAPSARQCETYRMDVKATARDCDGRIFTHLSCYDVTPGRC